MIVFILKFLIKNFLKLIEITVCGQVVSCSSYFSQTNILPSLKTISSWTFNLSLEESEYKIEPFNVSRGMLLILDQDQDGKVMVESSNFVSDLETDLNNFQNYLRPIDSKFSVRPIIKDFVESFFKFEKSYLTTGIYNLEIFFNISNFTIGKTLEIDIDQHFDFVCLNYIKKQINCSAYLISNFEITKTTINDKVYNPQIQIVDFLGFDFPSEPWEETFYENKFLLTSGEFRHDLNLKGFEILSTRPGYIFIKMVQVNVCGLDESCLSYLSQQNPTITIEEIKTWKYNLVLGINRIIFDFSFKATKGMILLLDQYDGKVGIDNSTNILTDFKLVQTSQLKFKLKILNKIKTLRFCVNTLIEQNLFKHLIIHNEVFSTYGQKVINAINNNSTITRSFSIDQSKKKYYK